MPSWDAPYLLATAEKELGRYRVLTASANLFLTDGGAKSTLIPSTLTYQAQSSTPITLNAASAHTQGITTGASNFIVNLAAGNGTNMTSKVFTIKKMDSGAGKVIITPNATNSDKVDGATTFTLYSQYDYVVIQCTGGNPANWMVIGRYIKPWTSAQQSITSGGVLSVSHPFGVVPGKVNFYLQCITAANGYSIGDVLQDEYVINSDYPTVAICCSTTTATVAFSNRNANVFYAVPKGGASIDQPLQNAGWGLYLVLGLL